MFITGKNIAEVINVKKITRNSFFKEKSFLALTLVSVLALAGVITVASVINKRQSGKNPYIDLNETTDSTKNTEQIIKNNEPESTDPSLVIQNPTEPSSVSDNTGQPVDVPPIALMFTENDTLMWPVEGNVILEFSMNASVYFATLDQYKYNPAMLIQSEEGTMVAAAADCVVTKVGSNEEIGTYVVMSLGGDYELTYGQLKSLKVSEGDIVNAGDIIGLVSAPTKYYVVEGCNLYVAPQLHNI